MIAEADTLDLALVGNCSISALIDGRGRIVWSCFPRFDGDPIFHALLGMPVRSQPSGVFEIELEDLRSTRQSYIPNTGVVRTVLEGARGAIEIVDVVPRFKQLERTFRPQMLVRRVRPLHGSPRIRIHVKPRHSYGAGEPDIAYGSNHIRYIGPRMTHRLTTDAPVDYIVEETPFIIDEPINMIFGPDETLMQGVAETARDMEERTRAYWCEWVNRLAVPLEWQDAVIRAAITLKMCSYEPTGGIVAAMTTSIPEAPASGRNWDYRYCWIRDAFFVVRALNSLSAVRTMEHYFRWMMNVVATTRGGHIQPVYGIGLEAQLTERIVSDLPGFRGMGPVRRGNQAYEQLQHDTYGNLILGATQAFFDRRLFMTVGAAEFHLLEAVGEQAYRLHAAADAGFWELRTRAHAHTSTAILSWAGCDRLAKIAQHLRLGDRADLWRARADEIKSILLASAWSDERGSFVGSFGGRGLDATVLLMAEVGLLDGTDPRFVATVEVVEKVLGRGPFMMRYEEEDDFGRPETAFNVCAFWRVDALARIGRHEQAREIFETLLAARNPLGLMSEDTDASTGQAWGNFPQTYSMVGIINCAMRLSRPWESAV